MNKEKYNDPTADMAVGNVMREQRMLKSCKYCGKIHDKKIECRQKKETLKKYREKKDDIETRFRWTSAWKRKAEMIKKRDLYLCQVCIRELYDVLKWDYLVSPTCETDGQTQAVVSYIKSRRNVMQLSGGQQQRVAIARALASKAPVLLADEPTGNLDEDTAKDIVEIFKSLAHDQDKCVIVVTHSKELAEEADVILTLKQGTVIATEDTVLEERIRG